MHKNYEALQESPFNKGAVAERLGVLKSKYETKKEGKNMIYYLAMAFSVVFLLFILNLVKKNKLDEKYSIVWIIFSLGILVISIFHDWVMGIALKLGVYYPPILLLLFAIMIEGIYIVHITITITKQNKMIIKLTQELAILKEKVEETDEEDDKR